MQKIFGILVLLLLNSCLFSVLPSVNSVESEQSIIIKSDGSITGTDKIEHDGDYYYLTDDINVSNFTLGIFAGITVQRDNIILDGKGFSIQNNASFSSGIDLSGRSNVTLQNLNIIGFCIGLYMFDGTSNNIIVENTIIGPSDQSFQIGIWLQGSTNDKLINNTVKGYNEFGVYLYLTSNCYISGNVVTDNKIGISVEYSTGNIFRDNQIYGNTENFLVAFKDFEDVVHDADDSNIVNGKPIYYWVNKHNISVPFDAGFVALINCSGISVQNLEISNNGVGILCYSTTGSAIKNNTFELNGNTIEIRNSQNITVSFNTINGSIHSGIRLASSYNIQIFENMLVNNAFGITLSGYNYQHTGYEGSNNVSIRCNNFTGNTPAIDVSRSNNNIISGNNFTDNGSAGIRLVNCQENLVVNNTFTANLAPAVYLSGATNNIFYHNNFINNRTEGLSISNPWFWGSGESESNNWDNGYEGNYWSDHSTRYPNATELDNSSIWNTPFVINEVNIDHFPLTDPVEIELVTIPEFESYIMLLIIGTATFVITVLVIIIYRKKIDNSVKQQN
ncbi:MAG: NosD domain-containing protein [Candidatus Bathyarchaeota archaeon]|nr:NosD domain-containing protein [Candidatus Bathyarchaeum tardum]WGM89376.1 MAG: NosD domain-containing protein [Candidatus Bathyarchaeum tardum]